MWIVLLYKRYLLLPRSFSYAGDLALVRKFSEADTADTVFAEVSVGTTADLASVVLTGGELLLFLLLVDHGLLCHFAYSSLTQFAKGAPMSLRSSRASSSVFAVVTNAMSIPRIFSTLSYSISGKISCSLRPSE